MKNIGTGILEAISTRQDGSIKLVIGTQELGSGEASKLFELRNKYIKYLLSDNNISEMDEKLIDELKLKDGKKIKTKSQRLRAVFYKIWELNPTGEFDVYYDEQMEILINHFKAKLD